MGLRSKKLLQDMLDAATAIQRFAKGRSFQEFEGDDLLQSAIERKFEIIGEAMR